MKVRCPNCKTTWELKSGWAGVLKTLIIFTGVIFILMLFLSFFMIRKYSSETENIEQKPIKLEPAELVKIRQRENQLKAMEKQIADREKACEAIAQKRAYEVYGNLKKLNPKHNSVKQYYFDSFEILPGKKIKFKLVNNFSKAASPDIRVDFLDQYGFYIGTVTVNWLVDEIQHGEVRYDTKDFSFPFGKAAYFSVIKSYRR